VETPCRRPFRPATTDPHGFRLIPGSSVLRFLAGMPR
jgi:hypothetical protein